MKRTLFVAYGLGSYLLFLVVYLGTCLFFGDLVLPRTIDGPVRTTPAVACAINFGLSLLFALQHSVMARPWFKRIWTRVVPQPIERATYVLFSSAALAALVWLWQPLAGTIWNVSNPIGRAVLWAVFIAGWLGVPAVSYLINHFDLFGLRQVWLHFLGRDYEPLPFHTPHLYRHVRHPLYLAWGVAFWATPTMSVGHALLAATLTLYMIIAVVWEERDLIAHFGETYHEYRRTVPKFLPRLTSRRR